MGEPPLSGAVHVIKMLSVAGMKAVTGAIGYAGICAAKIDTVLV